MNDEIKINKSNKSITFISNGIAFSQFGIADEILNLITNLQKENEKLKKAYERLTEDYVKKEYIVKAIENVFNEAEGDDKNE